MSFFRARQNLDGNLNTFNNIPQTKGGQWAPSDYGLIAWAFDPVMINANGTISGNGTMNLIALKVPAATVITNVILSMGIAGSGLTAGQNFAGLFQGGKLLASTADQSTNWAGSAGVQVMALTTPQAITAGMVYVGFYANGTTRPSFNVGLATAVGEVNWNLGSNPRFGYIAGSYTTSMPATLATIIARDYAFWAAVS